MGYRWTWLIGCAFLSACSGPLQPLPKTYPSPTPIWAPVKPETIDFSTLSSWMGNPDCQSSSAPLSQGQYLSRSCISAWGLTFAHELYTGQPVLKSSLLSAASEVAQDKIKNFQAHHQLCTGANLEVIGEPIFKNQGIANDGTYVWVIKVPVTSGQGAGACHQMLTLSLGRTHIESFNGIQVRNLFVRPLSETQIAQYRYQARLPYLPVQTLFAEPYSQPIYIDSPVPVQVDIFKGTELLFSQWMPAGAQSISTQDFPEGNYQVRLVMTGANGQFLRQYWQVVNKQ